MHLYKLILAMLIALPLLGLGCKKTTTQPAQPQADAGSQPTADAGPTVPEGWKVYKGKTFTIAYPGEWYARVDSLQNAKPVDLERVWFDFEEIPDFSDAETEPRFQMMLEVGSGSLQERITRYQPLLSRTTLKLDQREVIRFSYEDDFMGTTPVAYIFEEGGRVFLLLHTDGDNPNLETMIRTMEVL